MLLKDRYKAGLCVCACAISDVIRMLVVHALLSEPILLAINKTLRHCYCGCEATGGPFATVSTTFSLNKTKKGEPENIVEKCRFRGTLRLTGVCKVKLRRKYEKSYVK